MGRVVGSVLAVLLLGLTLAGPAAAKQVYLKDGGIIDCRSFRQVDGKVVVQVNRDVVVHLSSDEVDMKRTFQQKAVKKAKKQGKAKRKALAQPVAKPAKTGAPPAAPGQPGPAVPAKPAAPAAKPGAPAAKPAAPAQPTTQPGKPAPPTAKPAGAAPAGAPAAKTQVAAAAVKPATPAVQARPATPAPASVPPAKPAVAGQAQPSAPQPPVQPGGQPAVVANPAQAAATPPNAAVTPPQPGRISIPLRQDVPTPIPSVAALGAMMGTSVLVPFLLLLLICIVSLWKVFEKAGEAGWTCLIPIYNLFVLVKISGKPLWWFFLLFVPAVNLIFFVLMYLALAERFGKSQLFGVGLCFLGFIFFPILAFDNSRYS